MIPAEKAAAVTRALHEAFGVTAFEEITRLTNGNTSSLVFRIIVQGSPYLLKIITRPYDVDTMTRLFTGMAAASEVGLAPRVWYTSMEDRLFITDFVTAVPLPKADALVRLPANLRTLHALPPFPKTPDYFNTSCLFLMNKGPALDAFIERFQTANILTQAERDELFGLHAQLMAAYPYENADMVSSHNDLFKPDNMLFDGERLWFIDWEAAFLNDRYSDLAVVANLIVSNDAEEKVYLETYFGREPNEYQRARFYLMRQLTHLFYTLGSLLLGSFGQAVDRSESVPEFGEFQRRMWAGEVNLSDKTEKVRFGRAHWRRLLENAKGELFKESLKIVAEGQHT